MDDEQEQGATIDLDGKDILLIASALHVLKHAAQEEEREMINETIFKIISKVDEGVVVEDDGNIRRLLDWSGNCVMLDRIFASVWN